MKTSLVKMIPAGITRGICKVGFKFRQYSPQILLGAGIVGVGVTVVLACKETMKLEETTRDKRRAIETIREDLKNNMNEEDIHEDKKDLTREYMTMAKDVAILYAPSVAVGCLSVASILASHGIMSKRNVALMGAVKLTQEAFDEYRKRVVDELGIGKDREFRYGLSRGNESGTDGVPADGDEEESGHHSDGYSQDPRALDPTRRISQYARWFDADNRNWQRTPEYTLMFLRRVQQECNDLLRIKGIMLLNEVYEKLGIPRTKEGQIVGWVWHKHGEDGGDNFIDFGLYDGNDEFTRAFLNGQEDYVLLDFNVDGVVYDKLEKMDYEMRC